MGFIPALLVDYLGTGTKLLKDDNESADHKGCSYSIRVYPSQQFEDSHYTRQPLVYSCALASLFVFTSAIFLLYDYVVERRQKIVMKSATQSGMLVNHLFPEAVRDQLYREQQARTQAQRQEEDGHTNWEMQKEREEDDKIESKEAIASLYPQTTVFFADLAGFTKWSSTRTPVEVFQLLEALYGEFDKIAKKRRVFKVETIGDCYVAVTGIPKPQDDHAVIMCRFAADCMARMNSMMGSLAETLGADTSELAMRVGLHSGPVTAGVLRGEKARFQLFGDTVNTASRMESNGKKCHIHVSPATADELKAQGKGAWLTPRADKIVAKGKGEMQTYWVDVVSGAATTTSMS